MHICDKLYKLCPSKKVQVGGKDLKCRSDSCIWAGVEHRQAKGTPSCTCSRTGTLTVHLGSGPGEAQTTAVQVYNNSQEGLCGLCGAVSLSAAESIACRAGLCTLAAGAGPLAVLATVRVESRMRPATAVLAASVAVMCLALLSAISPGAGDAGLRESPPPRPQTRGEPLLGSSHQLQCTPDQALGKKPVVQAVQSLHPFKALSFQILK